MHFPSIVILMARRSGYSTIFPRQRVTFSGIVRLKDKELQKQQTYENTTRFAPCPDTGIGKYNRHLVHGG